MSGHPPAQAFWLRLFVTLWLAAASPLALAAYACAEASNTSGGWSPPECTTTSTMPVSSYACPAATDSRGGWIPPGCSCTDCGTIASITAVKDATGLGAVAGAVAGGLLGHQVGKGKGKTLATIAGAVGGGVAGHYGEKMLGKKQHWEIVVKMSDGSTRTVNMSSTPEFSVGDSVRIVDNSLVAN